MKKCLFFFLICLLILGGCSGRRTTPAERNSGSPREVQEPRLTLNQPEKNVPTEPVSTRQDRSASDSIISITLSGQEQLAYRVLKQPLLPEDMVIGPLGGEPGKNPVSVPLYGFFSALKSGNFNESFILESSRSYLKTVFQPILEEKLFPESFRLGEPRIYEQGQASVNVRLFAGSGRTAGRVSMEMQDDVWKISDLQLDFTELKKEYKKDFEVYEPQTYRWLELY